MFALLRALFTKEKRVTAAVILSMIVMPAIWFVLSGFLYPRAKILMPLITLIIWICAEELEDLTKPGSKKDILVLSLIHIFCNIFFPQIFYPSAFFKNYIEFFLTSG